MTKAEIERKKELARTLYLSGTVQKEIAGKVGVSNVTLSKWVSAEGWKEMRAARNITRPELVNKILRAIDRLLDEVGESMDGKNLSALSDRLAKFAAVIEKLDKRTSVVDAIEVFMAFGKWLEYRSETDPEVTPELIKVINRLQDKYIVEHLGK